MSKTVYVGMAVDILHDGHMSLIETARRYGDVVIGLLTDQAVLKFDRLPYLAYEHRKRILENVAGVKKVVPQDDLDYVPNLRKLRPDYLIHGGDWLNGTHSNYRDRSLAAMVEWGGQIIEMASAGGRGPGLLHVLDRVSGTTPTIRLRQLRRQLAGSGFARVLEVHSPLCGLIADIRHRRARRASGRLRRHVAEQPHGLAGQGQAGHRVRRPDLADHHHLGHPRDHHQAGGLRRRHRRHPRALRLHGQDAGAAGRLGGDHRRQDRPQEELALRHRRRADTGRHRRLRPQDRGTASGRR